MRNEGYGMRPNTRFCPSSFILRHSRRRGVIAFAALVMLSVLVVVTLAASEEMALEARAAQNRNAVRQAYLCAYTGIDYCLYLSRLAPNWRSALGAGGWLFNYPVGGGMVAVSADDPGDGLITGNPLDIVRLTVQATCGRAKRTLTILTQPPPGEALRYALCSLSNKDFWLGEGICVYGDIRTTGKVKADSGVSLAGNIYTLPGQTVQSTLLDGDTQVIRTELPVEAPPVDFAWYQGAAQSLILPNDGPNYAMTNARLTPDDNPFGFADPEGLYCVDAGGSEVRITDSYVVGTLVIVNATKVKIAGGYYHTTHLKQYPALLCDGAIEIRISRNLEEAPIAVDFNDDGDTADRFVSQIRGVIYSSKKITGFQTDDDPGPFYISGAVIADELDIWGRSFHVSYDTDLAETAVAGFQGEGLVLVGGSMED